MPEVVVSDVSIKYGAVTAVEDVSFSVRDGEFLTLLGPSGCGKSSLLAALAGFEVPTSGSIRIGSSEVFNGARKIHLAPEKRNLGMVFQSYALWPHMTIAQNCEYPLKLRKVPAAKRRRRALETLALVEMEALADRYPHQLSGGQQQRAALARTLIYQPDVLLLDEPLSNLDAKLRDRARAWLKELQSKIGITTIYVTHDHAEALSMSDRIAVMNAGRVVQLSTPADIYERPATSFVADFIGNSSFLPATLLSPTVAKLADGQEFKVEARKDLPPGEVMIAVRPQYVTMAAPGTGLHARITAKSYLGNHFLYELEIAKARIRAETTASYEPGPTNITIDPRQIVIFPRTDAQ